MEDLESIFELVGIIVGILGLGFILCLIIFNVDLFVRKQHHKFSFTKFVYTIFPIELKEDVRIALSAVSFSKSNNIQAIIKDRKTKVFESSYGKVIIPYHLDIANVDNEKFITLTERQKKVLYCLYTRSTNGYLRENYIKKLIESGIEDWCIPFVVSLCDDYIVEIVELIYFLLKERCNNDIKDFCKRNEMIVRRSYSRMVSYWNEYYRYGSKCWKLKYYPGRRLFKECLGIYE